LDENIFISLDDSKGAKAQQTTTAKEKMKQLSAEAFCWRCRRKIQRGKSHYWIYF
jgi:hypothetical protein